MRAKMIAALCGAGLMLGAPGAASAQEFIQNALESVGLASSKKPDIDYRERAPLVVPPKVGATLPPVQEEGSVAKANPSWPTDPDVERRRREAEDDNVPAGYTYKAYLNRENPWISPDELKRGRRAGAGQSSEPAAEVDERALVSPDVLRKGNPAMARSADNMVEPPRRRLTDPPTGYRTPSPTAANATAASPDAPRKGFWQRINPFSK